jgi:hypothetical protein
MDRIESKAVHHGRNRDTTGWKDDRYVRCSRCNFVLNQDRHSKAAYGSRAGQGVSHPDPASYNEAITYDNNGYTYNGHHSDFTITGGCPFCGSLTFTQEERK